MWKIFSDDHILSTIGDALRCLSIEDTHEISPNAIYAESDSAMKETHKRHTKTPSQQDLHFNVHT